MGALRRPACCKCAPLQCVKTSAEVAPLDQVEQMLRAPAEFPLVLSVEVPLRPGAEIAAVVPPLEVVGALPPLEVAGAPQLSIESRVLSDYQGGRQAVVGMQ